MFRRRVVGGAAIIPTVPGGPRQADPGGGVGAHNPGTRTGSYRASSTSQVTNEEGHSLLGAADYAIAFAGELENPRTHRAWLAIGY